MLEHRFLPSTIMVTNPGDGCNPVVPNTLRWAIANASNGDSIVFASSLSGQTIHLSPPCGALTITKSLTIINPNPVNVTISAGNQFTPFALLYGTTGGQRVPINVAASGLSITSGRGPYVPSPPAPAGGGGIYVSNYASLTLINSNISGNTVSGTGGNGGGIYNAGTLTLINSTVNSNSARFDGGGIDNDGTQGAGTLTVAANSVISGNRADGPPNTDSPLGGGIYNNAGTVTISNSSLTGNEVSGLSIGGGAIYNAGYLDVTNSDLSGNTSFSNSGSNSLGGAIFNGGVATITSSTLSSNQAIGGGGFDNRGGAIENQGTLSLISCTLASNHVPNNGGGGGGGGIFNSSALTIDSCTIMNNYAYAGGGIYSDSNSPGITIIRSTFAGNFTLGGDGGGINSLRSAMTLQDDTFNANTARSGGGIGNGGLLSLFGCTLAGNSASDSGGGISTDSVMLQVGNTIIAQNHASNGPDISGALGSQGHNLIGNGSGGSGFVGSDLVGTSANPIDPRLGPLQNNGGPTQTMMPLSATCQLPASPAIDAGDNNLPHPGTDQRGSPRISDGVIDIGASEVQLGPLAGFNLCTPASSTAGTPFNSVPVIATDAMGNTEVRYTGTVHFASSDSRATLPANATFTTADRGVHTFNGFTLFRSGSQSITATDVSTNQHGAAVVVVTPAAAGTLAIAGFPSPITAGSLGTFTVTALDPYGNVATGYRGTMHFTSSEPQAILPPDYALTAADAGSHAFSAVLKTAGTQTLTATDNGTATLTGTQTGILVTPAAADHLILSAPARVSPNTPLSVTVAARDPFNNVATGYTGTIHFSSSDPLAGLSPDYRFMPADAGQQTFTMTLATAGNQTITATDTANLALHGTAVVLVTRQLFYPPQDTPVGANPQTVAVGDFNGDGIPDLAVANSGDNTVSILLGQGDGTFVNAGTLATDLYPLSVAVGDFNGDGALDLVVVNRDSNTLTVFLGHGDGTFTATPFIPVGLFPTAVAVGNVNGDGIPDLVVADNGEAAVAVLLGNGDGFFQAPVSSSVGGFPESVAVGDFNGDGRLDVATVNPSSNTISVLLGNGDGTFQLDTQKIYRVGSGPVSLAVADLNGDGVPDLAVADSGRGDVSVLLGNGDGTFQPAQSYATGAMPMSVAIGDINGDGIPDLVVANQGDSTASVLIGNGDGSFQAAVSFAVGGGPAAVAVADFNVDGVADLVTTNTDADTISVLLNAGDWPTLPGCGSVANERKDRPAHAPVQLSIETIRASLPEPPLFLSVGMTDHDDTTRPAEQATVVDRLFRDAHEVRPSDADPNDTWTDWLLDDLGFTNSLAEWFSESLTHPDWQHSPRS